MRNIHHLMNGASLIGAIVMLLASPDTTRAAINPTFLTTPSSITMTHYDDLFASSPNSFTVTLPGTSIPASSSGFQMVNTLTSGTSNTVADGGVYENTGAGVMSVGLVTGTGVTQHNTGAYEGPSELNIGVNLSWKIGTSGFPSSGLLPAVTYAFNVGGFVGADGSVAFTMNMDYYDVVGAISTLVGTANIDYGTSATGNFSQLIAGSVIMNGGVKLPANSTMELMGNLAFQSTDPFSPTSINLISDGYVGASEVPLPSSSRMGLATLCLMGAAALWKQRRAAVV